MADAFGGRILIVQNSPYTGENVAAGVLIVRHSNITLPAPSISVNVLADSKNLGLKLCFYLISRVERIITS
jgi:hypothetical protein